MKTVKVKHLMCPVDEYPTVRDDATIYEAINSLEELTQKTPTRLFKHRAILVLSKDDKVLGKLDLWDLIRALEPNYDKIAKFDRLTHFGLNPDFVRNMVKDQELFTDSLQNHCKVAFHAKVADAYHPPEESEMIDEDADLGEAMHLLVMGNYLSLLATKAGRVTGILRLSDVFEKVAQLIKSCEEN